MRDICLSICKSGNICSSEANVDGVAVEANGDGTLIYNAKIRIWTRWQRKGKD